MENKIKYEPNMTCPYCGNEEFYVKQSFKGTCDYNMRFDRNNGNVENGEMWQNAEMKDISKYAYCNGCNKRLFNMEDYYSYED